MDNSINLDHLTLGVCYYPEQWDERLWPDDLDRMKAHGIEIIRVFEFAWSVVEPREGEYDFGLFDRFLDLAANKGVRVVMGTPTATPPAWLTRSYPEVLNADLQGNLMHHGHRRHVNYNSSVYHEFTRGIVTALAQRYGHHPAVIGWQIDNEINCEVDVFYSDADRTAFRQWLKRRFKTVEALNDAIGARFWSQSYSAWDQVDMERTTIHNHANPHMALLEKRFIADSAYQYIKLQSDILRHYTEGQFVTTNGIFNHMDNVKVARESLDFMLFDSYPNFGFGRENVGDADDRTDLRDRGAGWSLAQVRALSPNFGVMEQQSGAGGWDFRMIAPSPKPGQMRLWAYQSFAHGADMVSFFRWRTAAFGTEIYWHGLLNYDNRDNRRIAELDRIAAELVRLNKPCVAESVNGVTHSRYQAHVALALDYLNAWDGERDQWHGPLRNHSNRAIYEAAQLNNTPLDALCIDTLNDTTTLDALKSYAMIFYPHAAILTEKTAALLKSYCEQGGVLVMGARTGYKDEYGRCPMMPLPGFARELCGVTVDDFTFARTDEPAVGINWDGATYDAPIFHDILTPVDGGEALAVFGGGYYAGQTAMTRKSYASGGAAYYVGSGFTSEIAAALIKAHGLLSPYEDTIRCPQSVEISCRVNGDSAWFFLLNYAGETAEVTLSKPMTDALTGETITGVIAIGPYGVRVLV
ncbi:beta-galactosidase [Clostridia bacterium]|nr:beta-galactosidase [Clostridia bacterium]